MKKITEIDKIPVLTRKAFYSVNVGLSFLDTWLNEQIKEGLNLKPEFQRVKVWSRLQQIKYVEYFMRGGITGLDLYFNHTRWELDREVVDPEDYVIVDGRNRLLALILFVNNKLPIFGSRLDEFDKPSVLLRRNSQLRIHINNLQTKQEVLQWYLDFNSGGIVHTEDELNKVRLLLARYNDGKIKQ
jgi:hypothetical protein